MVNDKLPPLPSRLGKTTKTKGISGDPMEYTVVDEDVFVAPSSLESPRHGKAFAIYKLQHSDGRVQFRLGYYMIAHRPRMKGKWAWGQYATMMTPKEMAVIFERAKKKGWL